MPLKNVTLTLEKREGKTMRKKSKDILNLYLKKALISNNFLDEDYQTTIKRKMSIFYVLFQSIGKWLKVS